MKSVCVVAVYTVCMLMLLLCWPSVYCHYVTYMQRRGKKKHNITLDSTAIYVPSETLKQPCIAIN